MKTNLLIALVFAALIVLALGGWLVEGGRKLRSQARGLTPRPA